jgi:deoxyribodipyrimidine photo-lyase
MVNPLRVRQLNTGVFSACAGPVVYWMSRDQRVQDNWALLHAAGLAVQTQQPLEVVFCLRREYSHATARMVDFMLSGLAQVEQELAVKGVPFYFLLGEPEIELIAFLEKQTCI